MFQVTNVINRSSLFTKTPVLYNPLLIESDIKALKALFESQFDCVNSKESSRLFRSTFINASMVSEKSTEKQYEWILIQTNCYREIDRYITKESGPGVGNIIKSTRINFRFFFNGKIQLLDIVLFIITIVQFVFPGSFCVIYLVDCVIDFIQQI